MRVKGQRPKLTPGQVAEIKRRYRLCVDNRLVKIAEDMGISPSLASHAANVDCYKHHVAAERRKA